MNTESAAELINTLCTELQLSKPHKISYEEFLQQFSQRCNELILTDFNR